MYKLPKRHMTEHKGGPKASFCVYGDMGAIDGEKKVEELRKQMANKTRLKTPVSRREVRCRKKP